MTGKGSSEKDSEEGKLELRELRAKEGDSVQLSKIGGDSETKNLP